MHYHTGIIGRLCFVCILHYSADPVLILLALLPLLHFSFWAAALCMYLPTVWRGPLQFVCFFARFGGSGCFNRTYTPQRNTTVRPARYKSNICYDIWISSKYTWKLPSFETSGIPWGPPIFVALSCSKKTLPHTGAAWLAGRWLVDWLVGWLSGRMAAWLLGWLPGWCGKLVRLLHVQPLLWSVDIDYLYYSGTTQRESNY